MDKALQTMINNMPEKTGKSLDAWIELLKKQAFTKHSEAVKFLKDEYCVTHGFANTIVSLSKNNQDGPEELVMGQYTGKEALKPIYEKLLSVVNEFGNDVIVTPKKATVSLIRKKQFALIKPATKSRIDLGLKLKGVGITDRLEGSGPFGAMCTHRVQLKDQEAVDKELLGWLKMAYEMAN